MNKKRFALFLISLSIVLVATGQLVLKKGLSMSGPVSLYSMASILSQPLVFLGVMLFASSSLTWIIALSLSDLSFAYPLFGISYALVAFLSWFFFHDSFSTLRITGIITLVVGAFFLSRT